MDARGTVIERFQNIAPENFGEEIDRLWSSAEKIKETVVAQVEEGNLPAMNGLGIVSCVTAQTFGHAWFHNEATPADMLATLSPREKLGLTT